MVYQGLSPTWSIPKAEAFNVIPPILFAKESFCPHRKLQSAHMWVWNLNKYFVLETRCHRSTWRLLGSHNFSLPRYQGAQKARELWALLFSKLRNHMRNVAVIWASIFSGNNCSVRAELWKSSGPHNNIQANPNKENQIPFCFVHSWAWDSQTVRGQSLSTTHLGVNVMVMTLLSNSRFMCRKVSKKNYRIAFGCSFRL